MSSATQASFWVREGQSREKNTPGRSRGRREGKGLVEAGSDRKGIQFDPEESATQET